ncbi:hypothetical protein BDV96DRAFT_596359 [Lophiotrema nucula]|uniref:Uncharacterized protein n=1 Tax=Lophiotrema nucula TaxID=690887 RepID=A0A6A5ZK59_9PLEO|nr:hypothetical protein BDV96DRAFT_596359 [Lophiotrema nucula]
MDPPKPSLQLYQYPNFYSPQNQKKLLKPELWKNRRESDKQKPTSSIVAAIPPSSFFRIPGELRNIIYKEVLTTKSGQLVVMFRDGEGVVGPVAGISRDDFASGFSPGIHGFDVYEIFASDMDAYTMIVDPGDSPCNQLREVNRQLYEETNGLEFQYNSIVFGQAKGNFSSKGDDIEWIAHYYRPSSGLLKFAQHLSPVQFNRVTSVILYPDGDFRDRPHNLEEVVDDIRDTVNRVRGFCISNPRVVVKYIEPNWTCFPSPPIEQRAWDWDVIEDCDPDKFMEYGAFLALVLRRIDLRAFDEVLLEEWDDLIDRGDVVRRRYGEQNLINPSNFKIMPAMKNLEGRDAQMVETWLEFNGYDSKPHTEYTETLDDWVWADNRLTLWMQYARKWIEKGV